MHTISVDNVIIDDFKYHRNWVFINKLFFKHKNEYSGNSFGNILIVLYWCWQQMFENKFSDQWSSEHSL
jgi:hypothetical protein